MREIWDAFKELGWIGKIIFILFLPTLLWLMAIVERSKHEAKREKEIKKRYKKAIVRGLLWDTEIYIEREKPLI